MNYYPGSGLSIGTAILDAIGQEYPLGSSFDYCKLYGTIINATGQPVGSADTALNSNPDGSVALINTWRGVNITASISVADVVSGKIVSVDKMTTQTNEFGYFEISVLRGLTVSVTCSVFGKQVLIDTTGLTSKDLSSYF